MENNKISISKRKPKYYKRNIILNENLLDYIDDVSVPQRTKDIALKYTNGMSYEELSKEYGITKNRVSDLIQNYIHNVRCDLKYGRISNK